VLREADPVRVISQPPRQKVVAVRYNLDDSVQRVEMSQVADVPFGIYHRVSNNEGAVWESSNARTEASAR
jgi:hypothetical protein